MGSLGNYKQDCIESEKNWTVSFHRIGAQRKAAAVYAASLLQLSHPESYPATGCLRERSSSN
jgi:hypothetical protein